MRGRCKALTGKLITAPSGLPGRIWDFWFQAWSRHQSAHFPVPPLWPAACGHRMPRPCLSDWRVDGFRRRRPLVHVPDFSASRQLRVEDWITLPQIPSRFLECASHRPNNTVTIGEEACAQPNHSVGFRNSSGSFTKLAAIPRAVSDKPTTGLQQSPIK
jgi:hypothetical protein